MDQNPARFSETLKRGELEALTFPKNMQTCVIMPGNVLNNNPHLGMSSSPIKPCRTGENRLGEVGVRACG